MAETSERSLSGGSYTISAGTINVGGGVTASGSFSLPGDISGFAGTTSSRFNGNTTNVTASGSTVGSTSYGMGGGSTSTSGSVGLSYTHSGIFTVSQSATMSWTDYENSSYGLGQVTDSGSQGVSGSNTLTVLNVAPASVTLSLGASPINQGTHGSASMTGNEPGGTDSLTFNVNGHSATGSTGTPGGTQSSGSVDLGAYNVPGVYTITGSASTTGPAGTLTTNAASQLLTVLDVAPANVNVSIFSRVPVPMGASDMISFQASASSLNSLTYAWDLSHGGGPYTDQVGNNPTTPVQYFIGTHTISVQVSDAYGGVTTKDFAFVVIPEPASLVLLGLGGIAAIAVFRRRKRC